MAKTVRQLGEQARQWLRALPQNMKQAAVGLVHPTPQQKKKRRRWKRLGQLVLTLILVGIISASIIGSVLIVYVVKNFDAKSYLPELGRFSMDARSVIYVQNSNGAWEPYHNLLGGNSVWVDLDEIPVHLQNALVAIEDERFWDHDGVDWQRTATAMVNLLLNRVFHLGSTEYGGSTITQQLIRVTTQNTDHSIKRKVNEILAAMELERNESTKQQVLEAYLNNLPLTGELVGVGIGARYYFGKEAQELDLAESAVLVSITNNPSVYDPYQHPENVRQRQRLVLAKMYELNMITRDEYVQAVNEELVFKSSAVHQTVQDYYVDLVVEDVIADLMEEYGYTYNYAANMVYYGGLSIYSAEDPAKQKAVEAVYADEKNYPTHLEKDKEDPQTAFMAMDYTGRVVATIGGRGEKTANRVLNRSTQSTRSPGSSIKPLTSYGPAIALDLVHYSSVMRDAPIVLPNGTKWPHNYMVRNTPDNGDVLLGVALQKSLNTVAARLVQELTLQRSYDYAVNTFRLSTLVVGRDVNGNVMTDVAYSPLALGAFTDGVTVREMAAAYGVYGSGGFYNKPFTYYKVLQGEDEDASALLIAGKKSVMALDPQTCYVMIKLMQRVTTLGTAADISKSWPGWQVYGKTGTAENNCDVYFTGGTGYYVAASWFGYDNNQELTGKQTGYAKSLWNKAMKALHKNLPIKNFQAPSGVVAAKYCTKTGKLATDACPHTDTGTYKQSNVPGYCTEHAGNALPPVDPTTGETVKVTATEPEPAAPTQPAATGTTTTTAAEETTTAEPTTTTTQAVTP